MTRVKGQRTSEFGVKPGLLLCVCEYVSMGVYVCISAHVYTHVGVYAYDCVMCVGVLVSVVCVHMHVDICDYMYAHMCIGVSIYEIAHVYIGGVYVYVCEYLYMCVHCVCERLMCVPSLLYYSS